MMHGKGWLSMTRRGGIGGVVGIALAAGVAIADLPETSPPRRGQPDPVTLSAQDLDVREVLTMLARSRGLNMICSGDVTGQVTLDLQDVPFTEALRAVVAMAGLEATRRGDLYFVRRAAGGDPAATLLRDTRTFRLDYVTPEEILPILEQTLSPIGVATCYPPRRALVVEDRPEILDRVTELVGHLDVPPRQVMIEAQIIEARLAQDQHFGINWSLLFSSGEGSGDLNVEGFAAAAGSGSDGIFMSWGEGDFAGMVDALDGVEELNTLASPRLLAIDGSDAEIIIGGELGFSVVTTVENTIIQSVEFLDTGAQLRITPTITGDGYILMKVHPEVSDGVIQEGLPSKTTTEVTADVLIRDGQTLFIGGLIREREEYTRRGIPLLMRLPLLGGLFGRTIRSTQKSEVIALITARILQPGENYAFRRPEATRDE